MIAPVPATPEVVSLYSDRDRQRGYAINTKLVMLAYLIEAVIAGASLTGAAIFAQIYGSGDPSLMAMMVLAPIGYAVVEISRVPLALAVRTQASFWVRMLALAGVLCAAGVTVKSMSQLGEIMFRPRLTHVMHAQQKLEEARSNAANLELKIADADHLVRQRSDELQDAERQLTLATDKLGGLPEQNCMPISGTSRDGRTYKSMRCVADPRIAALTGSLSLARKERDAAGERLGAARAARAGIVRTGSEEQLARTQTDYREAVMDSQLHSFTAMVFGKNPTDVTDSEIHRFLRIFVFLPAICTALAATLVALAAVTRISADEPVLVDDAASNYVLAPLARQIIRQATEATLSGMQASAAPPHSPSVASFNGKVAT
jgi:hypothetical protein